MARPLAGPNLRKKCIYPSLPFPSLYSILPPLPSPPRRKAATLNPGREGLGSAVYKLTSEVYGAEPCRAEPWSQKHFGTFGAQRTYLVATIFVSERERSMSSPVRPSVCRLSSVCNVRLPYNKLVEIFGHFVP